MINLTPHPITLRGDDGTAVTIPPSGAVARVATADVPAGTATVPAAIDTGDPGVMHGDGFWPRAVLVPVVRRQFGAVTGLPADPVAVGGVLVSSLVLGAIPPGTPGIYAPDTGPTAVRGADGQIVAVTRLVAA